MTRATLEERLEDPGFTPGKRDFTELYGALTGPDEALADRVEKILVKAGTAAGDALVRDARKAPAPASTAFRVARVLGSLGGESAREYLHERLAEGSGKERRWAGTSLAKLSPENAEEPLLAALATATRGEDVRAFVQALGKVGGPRAREAIEALTSDDPETTRVVGKAKLLLSRTAERDTSGAVANMDVPLPQITVRVTCRDGLESVLAEELGTIGAAVTSTTKGRVTVMHKGRLSTLARSRTALGFAIEIDVPRRPEIDLPTRVVEVLESDAVAKVLAITGPHPVVRFRLEMPEGAGRAAIFDVAGKIAAKSATLRNDPTNSAWTFTVEQREHRLSVLLEPRQGMRARFATRLRDVPAASHPTVAAALVRLTRPRNDDVLWDPFCGAGTELLERAAFGPFAALVGSDNDEGALAAARENMQHAGITATLVAGSAVDCPLPEGISVVVTNPPLGRRIRGEHFPLLEALLARIGTILRPGGRFVWVSPGRRLDAQADRAGLRLVRAYDVDMGGFSGRIEVREKTNAT